jgi:hypothetical protein
VPQVRTGVPGTKTTGAKPPTTALISVSRFGYPFE